MPPMPTTRARRFASAAFLVVFGLIMAGAGSLPGAVPAAHAATARERVTDDPDRTVSVTGTGVELVEPDVVRLDLGVESVGDTAAAAFGDANQAMTRMQQALLARGVRASDMRTVGLWTQPRYEMVDGRSIRRGYVASQGLTVTLRNLSTAGATTSAAVEAGGDAVRINGARLDVDNLEAPRKVARAAAFAAARSAAEEYAKVAGGSLGPVVRIIESGGETPLPEQFLSLAKATDPTPIRPGTSEIKVTVSAVFALS
jgi:uncharacterized protein